MTLKARVTIVTLGFLASPLMAVAASGGPDAQGYTWRDSDEACVDPALPPFVPTDLRALGFTGDDTVVRVTLPASVFPTGFPYRGASYTSLWLSSNGWLSFIDPAGNSAPLPAALPGAAPPNATVAFFWDDWTLEGAGAGAQAGSNVAGNGFTIRFWVFSKTVPVRVAELGIVLGTTGSIEFFYDLEVAAMVGPATSIGCEDAAGAVGLEYMRAGVARGGASFRAAYAVAFLPAARLSCASAVTIDLANPAPILGDTTGGTSLVEAYDCATSAFGPPGPTSGYTGPESVYQFTLAAPSVVGFAFVAASPDQRLLLLQGCNDGCCVMAGGCGEVLAPGTYQLVVDGLNGAAGRFSITPIVRPPSPYNRWYDCPEECSGGCGQTPDAIGLRTWNFQNGNYCGTGCDFSMFAVVECGSEFHIPFSDVETFRMQVYDVLGQRYLDLAAANDSMTCPYTSTGTTVEWQDSGCPQIPCPGPGFGCDRFPPSGGDCRTNSVIMDVSFRGTPLLCGVYRLDFSNSGGFYWDLYANCTGARSEQFLIYRDLCSALASFRPVAEAALGAITVDASACPHVEGTVEVLNNGCGPALGLEVSIEQAPPLPPQARVYTLDAAPGQTQVLAWSYDLSAPQATLVFRVDPANRLTECSEGTGGCAIPGQRQVILDVCTRRCTTAAAAGPPAVVCEGQDHRLDGSASIFGCLTGGTPEYRWEDAAASALPGCDWSGVATCDVNRSLLPAGSHRFTLRTRCAGNLPDCPSTAIAVVDVTQGAVPPPLGSGLRLRRDRSIDLAFEWTPLPGAVALYRGYKDSDRRLPAATRSLVFELPAGSSAALESGGVLAAPATAYHQIVGVSCGGLEGPY